MRGWFRSLGSGYLATRNGVATPHGPDSRVVQHGQTCIVQQSAIVANIKGRITTVQLGHSDPMAQFHQPWMRLTISDVLGLASGHEPGQAKPGCDDSFIMALAWLVGLKSQSQAIRPWLLSELYFICINASKP